VLLVVQMKVCTTIITIVIVECCLIGNKNWVFPFSGIRLCACCSCTSQVGNLSRIIHEHCFFSMSSITHFFPDAFSSATAMVTNDYLSLLVAEFFNCYSLGYSSYFRTVLTFNLSSKQDNVIGKYEDKINCKLTELLFAMLIISWFNKVTAFISVAYF